jgi:hypothetical protein
VGVDGVALRQKLIRFTNHQKRNACIITKRRRKAPEFIRGDISRRFLQTFLSVLIGLWRYDIYREPAEVQVKYVEQPQNV